jgi:MFS family permease
MKQQLNALFTLQLINTFASSLFSIFVPIYLLTLHYTVKQIMIYYIIWSVGVLFFFLLSGIISKRSGLKILMIARLPFLFAYLLMLYSLDKIAIPLSVIALVDSIQVALYWFPFNVFFAQFSDKEKIGNDLGRLYALKQLLSIFAPILGGVIAKFFGFNILYFIAIVIYIFSILPLLRISEFKSVITFSKDKLVELFKKFPKYFLVETFRDIGANAELSIWPIVIFLSFNNILSVGNVGALFSVGGIIFSFLIGKYTDKINKKIFIYFGSIIFILVWIFRFYLHSEAAYYILTVVAGFVALLISIPLDAIFFSLAKKDNIDEFIIVREIPLLVSRIIFFGTCFLVSTLANAFWLIIVSYIVLILIFFNKKPFYRQIL